MKASMGFLGVIQLLIVVAIFTATVLSFKQSSKSFSHRKPLFAESYAEMLQRSKQAKMAKSGGAVPTPQPVQKPAVTASVKQSTTVKDSAPFDDATYDNLKFVIGEICFPHQPSFLLLLLVTGLQIHISF